MVVLLRYAILMRKIRKINKYTVTREASLPCKGYYEITTTLLLKYILSENQISGHFDPACHPRLKLAPAHSHLKDHKITTLIRFTKPQNHIICKTR